MAILVQREKGNKAYEEVGPEHPLATELLNASGQPIATDLNEIVTTSRCFATDRIVIPGVGAAVAYLSGDAMGLRFSFSVRREGTIQTVVFLDRDDEGINKDLVLFNREFTQTADNAAFAVSDADLLYCVGVISITTWNNFDANQVGMASPGLFYVAPEARLWCQVVTRGADNIAAGAEPIVFMVVT